MIWSKKAMSKIGKFKMEIIVLTLCLALIISIIVLAAPPEQGTPIINMTDHPFNKTTANITAYNVSSDNATKNIYNWYVDNESIAVLNLPFETNITEIIIIAMFFPYLYLK